jgi:hypothetical protein
LQSTQCIACSSEGVEGVKRRAVVVVVVVLLLWFHLSRTVGWTALTTVKYYRVCMCLRVCQLGVLLGGGEGGGERGVRNEC